MSHFVETVADVEVENRLWDATKRELLGFCQKFADRHVVGERRSDGQKDVCEAAKLKGYRITDVARIGAAIRSGRDFSDTLESYRESLGLAT